MSVSRRAVVGTTAWSIPAVVVASSSPAFAVSEEVCQVTGWYKDPGNGHATKDYYVRVECSDVPAISVSIYDDRNQEWKKAEYLGDYIWAAYGFNDSRRVRTVMINNDKQISVSFPPSTGPRNG